MKGIIYIYTSKTTGKNYIGQTIHEEHRKRQHLFLSKSANDHFHRAIRKYGISDFEYNILYSVESEDINYITKMLDMVEEYYISFYDSSNRIFGYNLKPGGSTGRGYTFSDIARANMRKGQLGKHRPASMRAKMSFPVVQFDTNGTFIAEYPSIMEASRVTGVNYSNISACCNGKRKSAGKFIWILKSKIQ